MNWKQTDSHVQWSDDKLFQLSSPLCKLSESQLCVVALFKQDKKAIERNCNTQVQFATILPPTGIGS